MAHVFTCLAINGHNMLVSQGVKDTPAIAPGADDIELSHLPELMGNGGLADADRGAEIANAKFNGIERGHDSKPGRIGHQTKK